MKKTKLPNLVAILVLTLITVVMWVSFSIYRAFSIKPTPAVSEEVLKPLSPVLDIETINLVESRIFIDDSQIPENVVTGPAQPINKPESTPEPQVPVIEEVPTSEPTTTP